MKYAFCWGRLGPVPLSIILLLAVSAGTGFTKRRFGSARASDYRSLLPETVEETANLSLSQLKISSHSWEWYPALPYCGPPFHIFPPLDDVPQTVVAGYEHYYDKGAKVFGCTDGAHVVFRGGVWFDLHEIAEKAPPLHVFVKSAVLHFKKDQNCPGEQLLIGGAYWMKKWPDGTLVPGDPFVSLPESSDLDSPTSIDVTTVVNNWIKGADNGGYANYGFVFKGPVEEDLKYGDNKSCIVRYSDLSLTVNYKYDKQPTILYVPSDKPTILVNPAVLATRKNVALAANGGVASASSILDPGYPASGAIDGDHIGANWGSGGGWADATSGAFPDWLQVDFSGTKTISEIYVFTLQDNYTSPGPVTDGLTFSKYGLTDFEVQYWDGTTWQTVPGGNITGNKLVQVKLGLSKPITTSKIKLVTKGAIDNGYSRVTEVEAWTK